jgi:hypothetical protein
VKRLLAVIIVAALIYGGWWFYAAQTLRGDVEKWFAAQRDAGWQAEYAEIVVRGFPNRTDLTLTAPVLVSPDMSLGWRAPFLQVLGLSYKTGHHIIAWPDTQTFTTQDGDIDISSDGLRASLIHDGDTILRSNLEATVLNLSGPDQAVATADVNAALERIGTTESDYRVALSVGSIAATTSEVSTNIGPESLGSLRAEMDVTFDTPLTLDGLVQTPPQPTGVTLTRSEIAYGSVTLRMSGDITLDTQGLATGEVAIVAENWRTAIDTARDNGDLPPEFATMVTELLTLLSTLNGPRDSLDVTLGLDRGTIRVGPLPIGTLPPLRWR